MQFYPDDARLTTICYNNSKHGTPHGVLKSEMKAVIRYKKGTLARKVKINAPKFYPKDAEVCGLVGCTLLALKRVCYLRVRSAVWKANLSLYRAKRAV